MPQTTRAAWAALIVMLAVTAAGDEPAVRVARARTLHAAGDCVGAATQLHAARNDAAAMQDVRRRDDALAMVHFYSALVFSNCGNEARARYELTEFFRLRPGHSTLDPTKFDPAFIRLFEDVQQHRSVTPFERVYPGFDLTQPSPASQSLKLWGSSSEFLILATDEDRERWGRLRDDLERAAFVDDFWRRREGMRVELIRRVRFADRAFPAPDERGALTDRGRVFVLLGVPGRVYRQALQRGETTFRNRGGRRPLDGELERWVYSSAQLPMAIPATYVEFRFITQPGYGQGVLEKDFMPLKALEQARKAILGTPE